MDGKSLWPEWLEPFSPIIEGYAEKLLGNSPLANTLKKTVVNSDVFKTNWNDPEKKADALEALARYFGKETAEALEENFNEYMGR